MTRWLCYFLPIVWITPTPQANAQITSNVFRRVLQVRVNHGKTNEGTATAFTIDVDGREYLITAKHVVAGFKDEDTLEISMDGKWTPQKVKVFRCENPVDIAVLIPDHQLTVNFPLPFDSGSFRFGQDAFFLGFPYGIQSASNGLNGPYPLALIKHGTISGSIAPDQNKEAGMLLLDGYNNPGFSGGPIVFRDFDQPGYQMDVVAVVSGFIPETVPVLKKHDIKSPAEASEEAKAQPWKIQRKADGSYFEYIENGTYVPLNTGIVEGYVLLPAITLIRQHPIGPLVKDMP